MDENEREIYQHQLIEEFLRKNAMYLANERGLKSGLAKGKKEGAIESKIEIAKNMLKKNMEIEDISEITGLTKDEIEKLK